MNERVIWKYALPTRGQFDLEMPNGAQCLSVQVQKGQPQLWALVDPSEFKRPRSFALLPTGAEFDACGRMEYIGTIQTHGEELVGHLFELT